MTDARAHLDHVGATHEIVDVDARLAECRVLNGEPDTALAEADEILARNGVDEAIAKLVPQLQRVRAHALILQGDPGAARDALRAAVDAARARNDPFEIAVSQNSRVVLDRLERVEPPAGAIDEIDAILAQYKVRALPPIPAFG